MLITLSPLDLQFSVKNRTVSHANIHTYRCKDREREGEEVLQAIKQDVDGSTGSNSLLIV